MDMQNKNGGYIYGMYLITSCESAHFSPGASATIHYHIHTPTDEHIICYDKDIAEGIALGLTILSTLENSAPNIWKSLTEYVLTSYPYGLPATELSAYLERAKKSNEVQEEAQELDK